MSQGERGERAVAVVTHVSTHAARNCADAKDALVGLGWKPKVAAVAVDGAVSVLGEGAALERLIFEALRRCPRA